MSKTLKVGLSGNIGSFSEEAANYYCQKNNLQKKELVYLISAENVLKAVDSGKVDLGIFPIENSNGGIVYEAVYAMSNYIFKIVNMFEIDVRHCLHALPGAKLEDIRKITSHQQALKQCRMYLKRQWPGVELEEYPDTAQAAKDLSSGILPADTAIIAPRRCAELYNLELIEEGIQDLKFNFTTFIAAEKQRN